MPPARPRNIDDSRSETSSTTNQKEKAVLGPATGSGISKGKRAASSALNGFSTAGKMAANGAVVPPSASVTAPATDKDPNLPRTDWVTMSTQILRTYRIAHRLPVPSAFNHSHAELTYASSNIALRAPSVVLSRRRLRDRKHQRRKLQQTQTNGTGKTIKMRDRQKEKEKEKPKDINHENNPSSTTNSIAQSIEPPDHSSDRGHPPSSPSVSSTTYLGPREPAAHLANAVRKHFNAQQLSESDTIARFIYVVQQNKRGVRTEGSEGDGSGYWMGSHGREIRKADGPGGEVGFRLRFRP